MAQTYDDGKVGLRIVQLWTAVVGAETLTILFRLMILAAQKAMI